MTDYDLLIVGAGIAGLSMAHYAAAAGLKVRVLERGSQAGGCLHSHRFIGEQDGFWLEPVSYTHLDVYKRQALRRRWRARGLFLP